MFKIIRSNIEIM